MKTLFLSTLALALMTSGAFALDCKNFPVITPDNAPVYGAKVNPNAGSNASLGGTAYTKATFCPAAAAPGTCTGESLSEKVQGNVDPNFFFGNIGNVPDTERHRLGLQVGPVFVPLTGFIAGAC